jgi:hypothetical protein
MKKMSQRYTPSIGLDVKSKVVVSLVSFIHDVNNERTLRMTYSKLLRLVEDASCVWSREGEDA